MIEPVLTVTTNNPYYLAHDCELKGVVYSDQQQTCKVGFVYSTSNDNPTVGPNDCKNYECYWTVDATSDGVEFDYAVSLDDMSIGNNYVRAYAIVNGGSNYVYGETKNIVLEATISFEDFEVQCENADVELSVMVYSTMPQHCEHGFVVSTTENPTYEQNDYLIGESDGDVDSHGTYYSGVGNNLEPGHYYVRAYAKGENGVYVYSEQKDFTVSGR